MSQPIIVWFRNDLRLHDHPALAAAVADGSAVLPVFILSRGLLHGRHAGSNRNRFLRECLAELKQELQDLGGNLVIREGDPAAVLTELAQQVGAAAVYYTADFTPHAIRRDKAVKAALEAAAVGFRSFGGRLIVDQLDTLTTKSGGPHKVFTPFWKNWQDAPRRPLVDRPTSLSLPSGVAAGQLPSLGDMTRKDELSPRVLPGGEAAGRKRLADWLDNGVNDYHRAHNEIAQDNTSRLSSYLHFGCVSAREIEDRLPGGQGAAAFHRQLAWREFYHYIIFKFPQNATREFQERYRDLSWDDNPQRLAAWQEGRTGYPIVDACMRQLNAEGWMHNRGRLIVGSFLTKDLWLDWRAGERYFMRMLIDGDEANNNGNWQWIASVGVDPAPVFRRLYNPSLQGERYDADGEFIRRFVPELKRVPTKHLGAPWKLSAEEQAAAGCVIGQDYPEPIVDHAEAREFALDQYRQAG